MTSPYDLNWRHLLAAARISEAGGIGAAVDTAHLSQPALTQALSRLEAALGAPLFDRGRRGMVPTRAGALFLARITRAETALTEGILALDRSTGRGQADVGVRSLTMSQLRAISALGHASGFAEAARRLGFSQPSVHRSVRELELLLGKPLVHRYGRGVALTPLARRFIRSAGLVRAELEAGLEELAALSHRSRGRIVVGAMPLARSGLLPRAVAAFLRDHPATAIRIVDGPYDDLLAGLLSADIDLLIGAARDPAPTDAVVQTPLFEDRLAVFGRNGHPIATPATPQTLAAYPWVAAPQGTPLRAEWDRLFAPLTTAPIPVECSAVETIRGLLLDGDWLTLIYPDQLRMEITSGLVRQIGDGHFGDARQIVQTTRRDWLPSPAQAAFQAALQAQADARS